MINIITKELHFDEELKKKIEFVCGFCNTTPTIINGNIRNIEQTNDTTSNLRDANSINIILKKYEDDLREHSNEVRNLQKKIKTRYNRIDKLEYDLDDANETTIDELEDKVSKLQEALSYFKNYGEILSSSCKINSYLLINMII